MTVKTIEHNSKAYEDMIRLRIEALLLPIGVPPSYIDPQKETEDIFIAAFEEDTMMGCCVLTPKDADTVQLRQMAVLQAYQGNRSGAAIVAFAIEEAIHKGFKKMVLNARDPVIGFYEKCGFHISSEQFFEVGLGHHQMTKILNSQPDRID